jgi:mannose-6-phosphate isomerase class I
LHTRFFDIHIIKNKFVTYYNFKNAKWIQIVVVDGNGRIDYFTKIKKGDCFIINNKKKKFVLSGELTVCVSYIKV